MDTDTRTKITGQQVLQLRTALRSIDLHATHAHDTITSRGHELNREFTANLIAVIEDLALLGLAVIEPFDPCPDDEYILARATQQTEYTVNAPAH